MNAVTKRLIASHKIAAGGVNYSPRQGALCPWCNNKTKIVSTRPWEDNTRIRYHRCLNTKCPISSGQVNIKSIEVDLVVNLGGD